VLVPDANSAEDGCWNDLKHIPMQLKDKEWVIGVIGWLRCC